LHFAIVVRAHNLCPVVTISHCGPGVPADCLRVAASNTHWIVGERTVCRWRHAACIVGTVVKLRSWHQSAPPDHVRLACCTVQGGNKRWFHRYIYICMYVYTVYSICSIYIHITAYRDVYC